MTQNGPYPGHSQPRSGREPEGQYAEPADPWSGQESWPQSPAPTPGAPLSPAGHLVGYAPGYGPTIPPQPGAPAPWGAPSPPQRRGPGGPIVALVVVLGLLVVAGLGTTVYLLREAGAPTSDAATPSTSARQPASVSQQPTASATAGSSDARFVVEGQCIRNSGTEQAPKIAVAPCGDGTFEVLKRINGRTTGEDDAKMKCSKVKNYSLWYFYNSELDTLDFVLCLKPR